MTQRLSALFVVLLITALCTAAMAASIPADPGVTIISGGHSTPVTGTSFGPFFPFLGTGAECVVDPPTTGDAFCSFVNENSDGLTFNTIALTIIGETFTSINPLTCFNAINPDSEAGGGCLVTNNTIRFFGLGIPPLDPGNPEWNFDFQSTFLHSIGSTFRTSQSNSIPEPASALLVGSGLTAVLALSRRRHLWRSKT